MYDDCNLITLIVSFLPGILIALAVVFKLKRPRSNGGLRGWLVLCLFSPTIGVHTYLLGISDQPEGTITGLCLSPFLTALAAAVVVFHLVRRYGEHASARPVTS